MKLVVRVADMNSGIDTRQRVKQHDGQVALYLRQADPVLDSQSAPEAGGAHGRREQRHRHPAEGEAA